MLTADENERLTRVGPGTPMGALLRRYWHPIAGREEMTNRWTKRVRLLGEDLVLFRDRTGAFGLIGEFCPHRRASLAYGIPTEDGIRCPYHGWKFDGSGRCLEQPNEPEGSNFKDKVRTAGYPVEELGGMLFAYLGPQPAPLVPRFDGFVEPNGIRMIGHATLPCNWLQMMENSMDPVHAEWLHGAFHEFVKESEGLKVAFSKRHVKIGFDEFPYGVIKRRLLEGQTEDVSDWKDGHPLIFPNGLAVGSGGGLWTQYAFQIRVPIDDVTTEHWWYNTYVPDDPADVPRHLFEEVPTFEVPYRNEQGEFLVEYVHGQDIMAWITQGPIADRTRESLAWTDRGVIYFRNLLKRELAKVERGEDPLGVIRDPAQNVRIDLPLEKNKDGFKDGFASLFKRHVPSFAPNANEIYDLFSSRRTPQRT